MSLPYLRHSMDGWMVHHSTLSSSFDFPVGHGMYSHSIIIMANILISHSALRSAEEWSWTPSLPTLLID